MKRFFLFLLGLAVFCIVAVTALPELWRVFPRLTMLAPMAPQFAVVASVLLLTALLARRWVLALLCLAVAVWNTQLIWPDITPLRAPAQADSGRVLKVVNFNLYFHNERLDETAAYLVNSGADVIGLVEARARAKVGLAHLKEAYPYSIDCIGIEPECQTMLFSKYPLKNAYAGAVDGRYPTIAIAEVQLPGGAVTVGVTHLNTPFVTAPRPALASNAIDPAPLLADAPRLEQSAQAANLARFLAKQPEDLILVGDFNSAPWSPIQIAFRAATGLDNRGHFLPSWPSWTWPVFRLSLDQVFVRGRAQVTRIGLGPDVGSDHLPVVAEIAVQPEPRQ